MNKILTKNGWQSLEESKVVPAADSKDPAVATHKYLLAHHERQWTHHAGEAEVMRDKHIKAKNNFDRDAYAAQQQHHEDQASYHDDQADVHRSALEKISRKK